MTEGGGDGLVDKGGGVQDGGQPGGPVGGATAAGGRPQRLGVGGGARGEKEATFLKMVRTIQIDSGRPGFVNGKLVGDPTNQDVICLLRDDLGVKVGEIEMVQFHTTVKLINIMFREDGKCQEVADKMRDGILWTSLGRQARGWMCNDQTKEIVIRNVPKQMPKEEIALEVSKWGEVKGLKMGDFEGYGDNVYDGCYRVLLKLHAGVTIPGFHYVPEGLGYDSQMWQLIYRGQMKEG